MGRPVAIFLSLSILGTAFVGAAWALTYRLTPESKRRRTLRWMASWFAKGVVLPMLLWMVMNLGLSWSLQPFMPEIQAAQNGGGSWFAVFLGVVGTGYFIVGSYWTALTLGWALLSARQGLEGEALGNFKDLSWTCFLGMIIPALGIGLLGGWPIFGFAATVVLAPIAAYAPAIVHAKRMPPMYARAVARIKFGKYAEAEMEIINELEKCEEDFEGWMMLADLYANQFHDLAEAEQTVLEICDHPKTTPSQLSIALHRLADWHLKLGNDPEAARRALLMVCARLRGSHLAHMAQLRVNQLPHNATELKEQRIARPIPLPALGDNMDAAPAGGESRMDRHQAAELANACVERLKEDPNDAASREKLARLLAEQLNKVDLGIEQLTLLLNVPDQPEAKRAEWLGLTAAWHIRYLHDADNGRKILDRIVQEFPHTPQALAAQRRLRLLQVPKLT